MSLRVHLQSSTGAGCRADADDVTFHIAQGTVQISAQMTSPCVSFDSANLEIWRAGKRRLFFLGYGFTTLSRRRIAVVTDCFSEALGASLPPSSNATEPRCCAVCEQRLGHDANCVTIGSKCVDLCCPHCAETFQRARRIIMDLDS